jgi:glycosyltransferase involved in cell wall biosynthesis
MADGMLRLVFAGAVTPTYELDVAVRALAIVRRRRPDLGARLDVYGRGDAQPDLEALAAAEGVSEATRFHGRIPIEEVPRAIAAADIGLATTRLDDFTRASLSTKVFEYAAMGKPVVCARLPMVERTFPPRTVWTYDPGDADSLADRILEVVGAGRERARAVKATRGIVTRRSWEADAPAYLGLLERFARDG